VVVVVVVVVVLVLAAAFGMSRPTRSCAYHHPRSTMKPIR
jgi:hypothetical protein